MTTWRNQLRLCLRCSQPFQPRREKQGYCKPACQNLAAVRRHRNHYTELPATPLPEKPLQPVLTPPTRPTSEVNRKFTCTSDVASTPYFNPHGPTPGALQGDDYPLEFHSDGYP